MKLESITPVVLSFDEQENITRTLGSLTDFPRVIVLDSGSTDQTRRLAEANANVEFFERPFDSHGNQWNHALSLARTDWVLCLDADYFCPAALIEEIQGLADDDQHVYGAGFDFCVFGKPLRRTLLPPRPVLFRRSRCRYVQDGHTQVLEPSTPSPLLRTRIRHDDRKPLSRWLSAQIRYARLEADKLSTRPRQDLDLPDRLRRLIVVMPWLTPIFVLLGKGLILDGWRGLHYAISRCLAETMLSLMLIDKRLRDEHETR